MKIKVDVISGFLGAGKTTLIKKLLEEKLHDEKLVIIENEFGEIGIDGGILKDTGVQVKEMNSGCICCTLSGDFEKAILEVIKKYTPDRIIIEPSGVGKLSDVIKACNTVKLKDVLTVNMCITVADVQKFQMYLSNFGEFYENQIKNAKTVILSRTQKADNEKILSVVRSIRALNSKANIITTPWEEIHGDLIVSVGEEDASAALEKEIKKVIIKRPHSHAHHHSADEVFSVWGIETPRIYEEEELRKMLRLMDSQKEFGTVLRGKGILQVQKGRWVQFDYVPDELNFKDVGADYTGRLCIIGKDLNKGRLAELFKVV